MDIKVQIADEELLTETQKNGIPSGIDAASMIVVDVTASVGGEELHELGGDVRITVPYDFSGLAEDETPVVYYIADDGTATEITDVVCDRANGTVTFTTNHFSGFIISVRVSGNTVSGNFKSFGDDPNEETTVQLFRRGTTELVDTATIVGNEGSYSFENVADGEYTLRVTKEHHVTREYDLTVGEDNEIPNVEIWLVGDVTGDGRISMVDYAKVLSHVKETSSLTGYAYDCGNVNGDGRISMVDYAKVLSHVKETSSLW